MGRDVSPKIDPSQVLEHETYELEGVDISGPFALTASICRTSVLGDVPPT